MTIATFVINLPRDTERLISIQNELAALQLSSQIIPAINGKDLSTQEMNGLYDARLNSKRYHRQLTLGEIGCYASHRLVWQKMVEQHIDYALILEDDVRLSSELPFILNQLVAQSTDCLSWDMVKFIGRSRESIADQQAFLLGYTWIHYHRTPSLSAAYVLTLAGAKKLLARPQFFRPIDVDFRYWWELDLGIAGILPYPVHLAEVSKISSIGAKHPKTWLERIKKPLLQWQYSLLNMYYSRSKLNH